MITGLKYYTAKELMYDTKPGIYLSPFAYKEFNKFKFDYSLEHKELFPTLDLLSFNDAPLFFCFSNELVSIIDSYLSFILEDINQKNSTLSIRNLDDMTLSRIYSEIEGTLNIESVPTTRKAISEIAFGKRNPKTSNEVIIDNMIKGIDFANKRPQFNEKNLSKLYAILSNDCLSEDYKLLEGHTYRHDGVEIDRYDGCPHNRIKECMDSLFAFVNKHLDNKKLYLYLPHIAHYYILYIHPYFDYNGRTARMVSYWIYLLINQKAIIPPVISEAINQTKSNYYSAIRESRNSSNDMTYFLTYIFNVSVQYFLTNKNIEEVDQLLKNKSVVLTNTEKSYYKKILISNKGKFTYSDFIKWINIKMSKQGAFKILNTFCTYGLLTGETTNSNSKLFEVNQEMLRYSFKKPEGKGHN